MNYRMALFMAAILAWTFSQAVATEYFVSKTGCDDSDGSSRAKAFLTVQKGVDALKPGDVLTIGPGEYFGGASRDYLGSPDEDTLIRAEIPGTVVLRGDVPLPPFRKVEGRRFLYATDFSGDEEVQAVNELDTLTIYRRAPNVSELDFCPGMFHQDKEGRKLYISMADLARNDKRRHTATVRGGSGILLKNAKRVRVSGLAATGFYRCGILLDKPDRCVISECLGYFNVGGGVATSGGWHGRTGDNVIERCVAWATGFGIHAQFPQRDVIRRSTAYLNICPGSIGIRVYNGHRSRQEDNLSWGNTSDFLLKQGGKDKVHEAERCVVAGTWHHESHSDLVVHSLVGKFHGPRKLFVDGIALAEQKSFDPNDEFADPANHDYRLQATSRFRGAAEDGSDLSPFPYEANLFYASPKGSDEADGLSAANAWATLGKAARSLRPGDTLYLESGRYDGDFHLDLEKRTDGPISIRGRGDGKVELTGSVTVEGGRGASFERLRFTGSVSASGVTDLRFDQCAFSGVGIALTIRDANGVRITHCEFRGEGKERVALSGCSNVFLGGNWFDNAAGTAVFVDRAEALIFADYDCYRCPAEAWRIAGKTVALDRLPQGWERYGTKTAPGEAGPGLGLHDWPAGNYRLERSVAKRVVGPFVHSTGATSANLEWFCSEPATVEIAWGETPECGNALTLNSERFGSFSLNGLKPASTYYFRLRAVGPAFPRVYGAVVSDLAKARQLLAANDGWEWNAKPVSFETLDHSLAPVTYYVAPDGDDANSGRERGKALRTLAKACDIVRPGDAVRVAAGVYRERLRTRVTGEVGRPISFAAIPGERVVLDGDERRMSNLVSSFNKSHLRLDGFYLRNVVLPSLWTAATVRLLGGEDILLTRCFYDGRSGYSPTFVYAAGVKDLLVKNCVSISAFSCSPRVLGCRRFRMENCLIIHNLIGGTYIDGVPGGEIVLRNNVFTDCQKNKIKVGIGPMASSKTIRLENNAWFFRPEREAQGDHSMVYATVPMKDFAETVARDGGVIGDPKFAVLYRDGVDPAKGLGNGFTVEHLIGERSKYDNLTFSDLFATNPEFVKRGIGLNPDDFSE